MFIFKLLFALFLNTAIFGGLLFLPAGTLDWWRAWVFLDVISVGVIATMVDVFRDNEALWNERLKPPIQKGQPLADKIITSLLIISFLSSLAFIPLDVFRFHLFGKPNAIVSAFGLVLFVIGWAILHLSFKENTFAAPVVKHQADRQQTVIDTGVYGIVRHPMYAGAVLLTIGMPLWLESYAAALLAILPIALLVVRILFEEQFLRAELKGYDAYTEKIRFRLLPYLW
jgi:protein-S-isoprenylcysteine O-methyltransferase Ste14